MLAKLYLIAYNLGMTIGWAYVLFLSWQKRKEPENIWEHVKGPLVVFQSGAILEVVHAATGIVKSSVILTFIQVLSRVYLIWGVLFLCPPSTTSIGVALCMVAWDITEIIRYGYYFLNLVGLAKLIVWFRYTLFIVLYPLGITGELLCIYAALPYIQKHKLLTFTMPNAFNVTFDYYYFMILVMLSYIPFFPLLYTHMLAQRKKILGGGEKKKVK